MKARIPHFFFILGACLFFTFILGLVGCTTDIFSSRSSTQLSTTASGYLQMANTVTPTQALEYRIRAADLYVQAGETIQAQRALREVDLNTVEGDESIRTSILQARLALLKNDLARARILLSDALSKLTHHTSANLPTGNGQRIALLLPTKGPHAEAASAIRDGFLAAYYKTVQHQPSDPSVKLYDTGSGNKIAEAYQNALAERSSIIVGPLSKPEVQTISKMHLTVPILALNTISEGPMPHQFYQFGLMPEDEVIAVSEHAFRQGRRRALVLAPDSEWGHRLSETFKKQWKSRGGIVVTEQYFNTRDLSEKIKTLLGVKNEARRIDVDMIFLAASTDSARQIKPLLNFYYAENLPVYATSTVYTGIPAPNKDQDLNGIHFCDMPWMLENSASVQETRDSVAKLWPKSFARSPRFFAFGIDAYQLAIQLGGSTQLPSYGLAGLTGQLHLNRNQRIERGLTCARFEQGVPVPD